MNMVFWVLVLIICLIAYFVLSFVFKAIGDISIKIYKKFKNNIGRGEMNNEK